VCVFVGVRVVCVCVCVCVCVRARLCRFIHWYANRTAQLLLQFV
jgi:hypothetical protein